MVQRRSYAAPYVANEDRHGSGRYPRRRMETRRRCDHKGRLYQLQCGTHLEPKAAKGTFVASAGKLGHFPMETLPAGTQVGSRYNTAAQPGGHVEEARTPDLTTTTSPAALSQKMWRKTRLPQLSSWCQQPDRARTEWPSAEGSEGTVAAHVLAALFSGSCLAAYPHLTHLSEKRRR